MLILKVATCFKDEWFLFTLLTVKEQNMFVAVLVKCKQFLLLWL